MAEVAERIETTTPEASEQAEPRLTRLELHGFKSFASRTVFQFQPGITAVVGPNGSGKSNVADGVRWVLGEQSHGLLRSKKTEDVIFAGGRGRAQSGMAEVAVTFDNTTGWLPIAFTEVTVTRRAYRSGENQYLINGRRVRLKDVQHLTATLGQSYTVVGQGLIDSALSQRPEERRGLFEHAADLTGLRLKAAEAERNLNETESNSARLTDLLTELEPRLKTLERAARQANEYRGLAERLRGLQRSHYGRLLRAAHARFAEADAAASSEESAVEQATARVDTLQAATEAARTAADAARTALGQHDTGLQVTTEQARRVAHERDLARERHAALSRRREDMADTQAGLDEQVATVTADLASVAEELFDLEAEVAAAREAVNTLQTATNAARTARAQAEKRAGALAQTLTEHERKTADLARRRALLAQRGETDTAERDRLAAEIAERAARLADLERELTGFDEAAAKDTAAIGEIDHRLATLATETEHANATLRAARERVAEAERQLDAGKTRLDVLQKLAESGAGLYAGVKATLQAARKGTLGGIRGTVAELVETPPVYDTAIEVALGGHLQDVVVERWVDAEAAIAYLKKSGSGRATFQPLDTVRAQFGSSGGRGVSDALALPGVHGIAAELVGSGEDVVVVVRALLGRTLVVDDLPAARRVLPALPNGWSAVTLAGEIARTGGSVTGGAAVRESGTLGRERELRDLPKEIQKRIAARDEAVAAVSTAEDAPRTLAETRQGIEAERAGLLAAKAERGSQRTRLARWRDDLQFEQDATEGRLKAITTATWGRDADAAKLDAEEAALREAAATARKDHETALADLARETEAAADGDRALAAEGRRLAALEERLRAERRRETGLRSQERALAEELALRGERAAALDGERTALAAQADRLTQEATTLEAERARLAAARAPLETAARRAEADIARLDRDLTVAREDLLAAERSHGAQGLALERALGELATIRQRITDDLELEAPDELLAVTEGAEGAETAEDEMLSSSSAVSAPSAPSETLEREIARLKERLRRVGWVGEDVVAEYEAESARQEFLRGQLADVQAAAASLRTLLADLRMTMQTRFDETFARVSTAFTEAFTTLFGGGTARLVLAEDEDGEPGGIDIVAQPPGKRLQGLALLSGGERALTAAALLIAILRVHPTPFCLLDEVDAALDEANVVRFREQLQQLADETQVVVITHNRGTIEIADTLYGVSMGDDGVSQILSLRLADAVAQARSG